ncbi:MAG TPA: hypothetical protein DCM87_19625 [Planctomycetes bacterium]|nr:hypothetical protein [Planctomycetota bacterium]
MIVYLDLTEKFNRGRTRAILAGGQAVVLHRLAIMSKDGDWILREEFEAAQHVLAVLEECGARYRFGAPLDVRWLAGGWSAHFEFQSAGLRVRTDFVTRPPRLDGEALRRVWRDADGQEAPFLGAMDLAEAKKTNREKDYAVIGELARKMTTAESRLLYSRSARDLIALAELHPDAMRRAAERRPALAAVAQGRETLEAALDVERRRLIRANEERLAKYMDAAEPWAALWPELSRQMAGRSLSEAHTMMVERADAALPHSVPGGWP